MKILYITTPNPRAQGDFQENVILHGLRSLIGSSLIDLPRKKVMYGDFSETSRDEMHGRGFTLYTNPLQDLDVNQRKIIDKEIDVILYGVTNAYGVTDFPEVNKICKNIWYLDGHDTSDIKKKPCFKRELFSEEENVYPTGFGIPHYQIRPIDLGRKNQKYQKTVPAEAFFKPDVMQHLRLHYPYTWEQENEYYLDMQKSWFGITCKKGGWDSLRHYEIMAAGSLLLFKQYQDKPVLCAPQNLPCYSYSSLEELDDLMDRLVQNNKPTKEYIEMLFAQREWLLKYGTTEARSLEILKTLLSST
jgi:hypothetical protein